jgi:hypothetical protein
MKRHRILLCVLLLSVPRLLGAAAQFQTIDVGFPGAGNTVVTGLTERGLALGFYLDAEGHDQGFLRTPGGRTTMLLGVVPQAITRGERIVGWYQAPSGMTRGFLLQAGTLTPITGPLVPGTGYPPLVEALDVNESGLVVGQFRSQVDGRFHGFLYDSASQTFTQIDVPGATQTALTGVNALGQQVGSFRDASDQRHVFRREGETVTVITVPGLAEVDLVGLAEDGRLVGNTPERGFVVAQGVVDLIEVPGATRTQLFGLRGDGTVYGRFLDSAGVAHGFVAVPERSRLNLEPDPRPLLRAFELIDCLPGSPRPACQ